jgi:hypothetical protein
MTICDSERKRTQRFVCAISILSAIALAATQQARGQPSSATETVLPISAALCDDMKARHVLGPTTPVACDRLRLVKFSYVDFDNRLHHDGEVVVMDAASVHVLRIFRSLREIRFPIAKARLMNQYDGDDDASMRDNNTSAFNDRQIADNSKISLHSYALAIDVNPVQNPFVTRSGATLAFDPEAGIEYANRLIERPWKATRHGLAEEVLDIFAENGFLIWGGDWDNPIDYQHFQVGRELAKRLARLPAPEAAVEFNRVVQRYRHCRRGSARNLGPSRAACVMIADPTSSQT